MFKSTEHLCDLARTNGRSSGNTSRVANFPECILLNLEEKDLPEGIHNYGGT